MVWLIFGRLRESTDGGQCRSEDTNRQAKQTKLETHTPYDDKQETQTKESEL